MPKPPIVWYTDADSVPQRDVPDRLDKISALMKRFEKGDMSLQEFNDEYEDLLNSE